MVCQSRHWLEHRSNIYISLLGMLLLLTPGCFASAKGAQQSSPLVRQEYQSQDYPTEVESSEQYETFKGVKLEATEAGGPIEATMTVGAAALIQPGLTTNLVLKNATVIPIKAPPTPTGEESAGPQIEKVFITYPLEYETIPLSKGSEVMATLNGQGELLSVRKRNLPKEIDSTTPTVKPVDAIEIGKAHAQKLSAQKAELETNSPSLELWVNPADQKGHLAWTFIVRSKSKTNPLSNKYWISAIQEPKILYWENMVFHEHQGKVSGTVWTKSPFQPSERRPSVNLELVRLDLNTPIITTNDGSYAFQGTGTIELRANLHGPFAVIDNAGGSAMEENATCDDNNPIDITFNASDDTELAQTSAFYWANVAYHFAHSILDPLQRKPFEKLQTKVNLDKTCDAYWDGWAIHFFNSGNGCPNTAYADFVLHEYGHAIDYWSGGQKGTKDGRGYSEGFGDAIAILVTRQPCMGRELFGPDTCLRNAGDPNKKDMWPPAVDEDEHDIGKRYAQFTWQLIQEFEKSMSEDEAFSLTSRLTLASAAQNPKSIPDAVKLILVADDGNEVDLSNGTPHCKEIASAATSRKIPLPSDLRCP